jgi:hypothetical protein
VSPRPKTPPESPFRHFRRFETEIAGEVFDAEGYLKEILYTAKPFRDVPGVFFCIGQRQQVVIMGAVDSVPAIYSIITGNHYKLFSAFREWDLSGHVGRGIEKPPVNSRRRPQPLVLLRLSGKAKGIAGAF